MPKITDIQTIRTRSTGTWLFVKILTDQPGLYGIGSSSDHFRCKVVQAAIENIKPLLIGREVGRIEDIWQSVYTSGYWRNDSVMNTVQAGIDMALWLVGQLWEPAFARRVQRYIQYEPAPPYAAEV